MEREAFSIIVINETRSLRHCFVMEVGIGSSVQLFVGDFIMSSRINLFGHWLELREQKALHKQQRLVGHMSASPGLRVCV